MEEWNVGKIFGKRLELWLVNLPPPNVPPPRNKALVSLNKALLNPYFWGVTMGGVG